MKAIIGAFLRNQKWHCVFGAGNFLLRKLLPAKKLKVVKCGKKRNQFNLSVKVFSPLAKKRAHTRKQIKPVMRPGPDDATNK